MSEFIPVIVTCGERKQSTSVEAGEMYTGPYHRALLTYALSIVPPEHVYILSALHGLLPLDRIIEPYNQRWGQPGAISREEVEWQAHMLGLWGEVPLVLGGKDYVQLTREIFGEVISPLRGGMGQQIGQVSRNRGRWPQDWRT